MYLQRRGVALVELAILMPFLLLMVIGVVEMGRAVMVRQELVNAAREGARRGIVPGATTAVVTSTVNNYFTTTSIAGATKTVEVVDKNGVASEVAALDSHEPIHVRVSVPFEEASWGMTGFFIRGDLHAEVVMRKE